MEVPVTRRPIVWEPGEGRRYGMGALEAIFKADAPEVEGRFSISEWWLEARHEGPGAPKHDENEEMFYVLEGIASILLGDEWRQLAKGGMCIIPRGVMHDFRNEGSVRMGLLNIFLPGPFEHMMPTIVDWYRDNPARPIE